MMKPSTKSILMLIVGAVASSVALLEGLNPFIGGGLMSCGLFFIAGAIFTY